jgi:predicted HD phosphohydrolase
MSNMSNVSNVWQYLIDLYDKQGGAQYSISEPITQLNHAVQCGKLALAKYPSHPCFVMACLLHDVGQLQYKCGADAEKYGDAADEYGLSTHASLGAQWLSDNGFPPDVYELVRRHVTAKRYLVGRDEKYAGCLSAASQHTLQQQGGPMLREEADAFEQDPYFHDSVALRRLDDQSKSTEVNYGLSDFCDFGCVYDKLKK